MAPRRASTRGDTSTPANRCVASGGIRKNTRNRQPPSRYGQVPDSAIRPSNSGEGTGLSSTSNEVEPSTPRYSHSPTPNIQQSISRTLSAAASSPEPRTPTISSLDYQASSPRQQADIPINLNMMQELLRSNEQEIVNRVLHQLTSQSHTQPVTSSHIPQPAHPAIVNSPLPQSNSTHKRIRELEFQLAELKGKVSAQQRSNAEPGTMSTDIPIQYSIPQGGESASATANSGEY